MYNNMENVNSYPATWKHYNNLLCKAGNNTIILNTF